MPFSSVKGVLLGVLFWLPMLTLTTMDYIRLRHPQWLWGCLPQSSQMALGSIATGMWMVLLAPGLTTLEFLGHRLFILFWVNFFGILADRTVGVGVGLEGLGEILPYNVTRGTISCKCHPHLRLLFEGEKKLQAFFFSSF